MSNTSYDGTRPVHDFPGGSANSAGAILSHTASMVSGWRSYTANDATSGSSYGGRFQHYIIGAQGSGAALRPYALVKGVAAGSLYAIEATAEIMSTSSSSVDDELYAIKGVLNIDLSSTTNQVAALDLEIDVASGKTLAAVGGSAFIKCDITGTGTWVPSLFYLPDAIGDKSDTALVTTVHGASTQTHAIKINAAGTTMWIMCSTDSNAS
jgi:hypothetical protein